MISNQKKYINLQARKTTMTKPEISKRITEAIDNKGIINLTADDFSNVLDGGKRVTSFLANGDGEKSLKDALDKISKEAESEGINLFACKNLVISISTSSQLDALQNFEVVQLDALNDFLSRFGNGFTVKWGLYTFPGLEENQVEVLLIAC